MGNTQHFCYLSCNEEAIQSSSWEKGLAKDVSQAPSGLPSTRRTSITEHNLGNTWGKVGFLVASSICLHPDSNASCDAWQRWLRDYLWCFRATVWFSHPAVCYLSGNGLIKKHTEEKTEWGCSHLNCVTWRRVGLLPSNLAKSPVMWISTTLLPWLLYPKQCSRAWVAFNR